MRNIRKQKGITLIALVITIIVLIILAAATLGVLIGDNGIITRAKQARENTGTKQEAELVNLVASKIRIEEKTGETLTEENLQTYINEVFGTNKATGSISNGNYIITVIGGKIYTITSSGVQQLVDEEELSSLYYSNYIIMKNHNLYANMWNDAWPFGQEGKYLIIADVSKLNENQHKGYVGVYNSLDECVEAYKDGTLTQGSNYVGVTYTDSTGHTCYANCFWKLETWGISDYYSNQNIGNFEIKPLMVAKNPNDNKEVLSSTHYSNYVIMENNNLYANRWNDAWNFAEEGKYLIIADVTYLNANQHQGYVGVYNSLNECIEAYQNGTLTVGSSFIGVTYTDSTGYTCYANCFWQIEGWASRASVYYSNQNLGNFVKKPLIINE